MRGDGQRTGCLKLRCWREGCNLYDPGEWGPGVGQEVIMGAKNVEEWRGQDVEWIIHVNVEVKNDDKSRVGEESREPGEGGQEVHGDSTMGKKVMKNDTWACNPQVRLLSC